MGILQNSDRYIRLILLYGNKQVPAEQTEAGHARSLEIWEDTRRKAEENRLDEVAADHYIKYYGTLRKIARDQRNRRVPADLDWPDGDPPNEWIYGPTGTGKSFAARKDNPGCYLKMNNKWWENYEGEAVVLIEDVGKTHEWMGDFLKIWADKYTFRNELKHDSIVLRPQKIVVTSNYAIEELWPDPSIYEPLLRRFKVIHKTKLLGKDPTKARVKTPVKRPDKRSKPLPKPALYRQDAKGKLVPNQNRQTVLDRQIHTPLGWSKQPKRKRDSDRIDSDDLDEWEPSPKVSYKETQMYSSEESSDSSSSSSIFIDLTK